MAVLAYPFPVPLYCHVHGILVVSSPPSQVRAYTPKRPRAELTFDMDIAEVVYFNDKYDNNKFTVASKRILRARRVRIWTNILEEKCNKLLVVTDLVTYTWFNGNTISRVPYCHVQEVRNLMVNASKLRVSKKASTPYKMRNKSLSEFFTAQESRTQSSALTKPGKPQRQIVSKEKMDILLGQSICNIYIILRVN